MDCVYQRELGNYLLTDFVSLCRRVLQSLHNQRQFVIPGGGRISAQQRPIQPARLGHSGALRVHQDGRHKVSVHLRCRHVWQDVGQSRVRPDVQMSAASLRPAAGQNN